MEASAPSLEAGGLSATLALAGAAIV